MCLDVKNNARRTIHYLLAKVKPLITKKDSFMKALLADLEIHMSCAQDFNLHIYSCNAGCHFRVTGRGH